MISFFLVVSIVIHWMACGWFLLHVLMIGDENEYGATADDSDPLLWTTTSPTHGHRAPMSWVTRLPGVWGDSIWRLEELYVASIYWSVMTLTTIGYGDINPKTTIERIYVIFAMLVGAGLFSFILSEMAILIAALSRRSSQYKSTVDRLTTYMQRKKLPMWLRRKALDFCADAYENNVLEIRFQDGGGEGNRSHGSTNHTIGDAGLLTLFSPYLQATMGYHMYVLFFSLFLTSTSYIFNLFELYTLRTLSCTSCLIIF